MTSVMGFRPSRLYLATMRIFEELRREHDLIDRVAGSFRTWVAQAIGGDAPVEDGRKFAEFFKVYTGGLHHDREEMVVFPTVWTTLGLRPDTAPITVTIDAHHELSALLECIRSLVEQPKLSGQALQEVENLATRYTRLLWNHIDAENSVLFPELENRLLHAGVHELPTRPMSDAEERAAAAGQELIHRYPPSDDTEIVRGEGCAMCPEYLASCAGIEREWWNEWEWEELEERVAST